MKLVGSVAGCIYFNLNLGSLCDYRYMAKHRKNVHTIILHYVDRKKMSMGQMGRRGVDAEQHFHVTFVQSTFSWASIANCERVTGHYGTLTKSSF